MRKTTGLAWLAGFLMAVSGLVCAIAQDDNPPPMPAQEQPEAMTRGPVHEAFAEPVQTRQEDGLTASVEPPAPIAETPPAERPVGTRVVWVLGYWAWDAERHGYIWVSGCWRVAPPHMAWMPGYWARVEGGWEWVPGFWTAAADRAIDYLPPPPELTDVGPPAQPPSAEFTWVPPCWYWCDGRYVMRQGYWLAVQPDWVWTPSHYIRTPRGYIFVAGHWDFALERRGVLFAPVVFAPGFYARAGFFYSPSVVVDVNVLTVNFFTYPRYCHYYFGDYYDDVYISVGIFPWFEVERRHAWCDPIFNHDRWRHRGDSHWMDHERHEYDARRSDRDLRPARTIRDMEARVAKAPEPQRRDLRVVQPLNRYVEDKSATVKFEHVSAQVRQEIAKRATDSERFRDERTRWESKKALPPVQGSPSGSTPPTPLEHREAAPSKDQHRETTTSPKAAPDQHRETNTSPKAAPDQHRETTTPPKGAPDQRPVPDKPSEHKDPKASSDRRGPDAAPPAGDTKDSSAASGDRKAAAPSRDTRSGRADRVKIPSPPISDQPSPPASPGGGSSGGGGASRSGDDGRSSDRGGDRGGDRGSDRGGDSSGGGGGGDSRGGEGRGRK